MGNAGRQCSKCQFYEGDATYGECRALPPVLQYLVVPHGDDGRIEQRKGWPGVNPDDWCGKFNSK